ncbi:hypothetical protein SAMN05216276_106510 [Streptosporangium subroseum]|uniref:Uncharacterized protein n=1 Tax=Streptosporangium subroseum TaxID=106412 RepID=A0A239NRN1_9ACTN|nr:hypothetical protein [Streptosporangium subroseum]SNT56769.1 hypothetical protein SAMN05216276_106510 [Streptosporangium subroseum]
MTPPEEHALQQPWFSEAEAEQAVHQLATLQQIYPDWKIACVSDLDQPIWYAILRTTLTEGQKVAGNRQTFMRSSAEALTSALAAQEKRQHNCPITNHFIS